MFIIIYKYKQQKIVVTQKEYNITDNALKSAKFCTTCYCPPIFSFSKKNGGGRKRERTVQVN